MHLSIKLRDDVTTAKEGKQVIIVGVLLLIVGLAGTFTIFYFRLSTAPPVEPPLPQGIPPDALGQVLEKTAISAGDPVSVTEDSFIIANNWNGGTLHVEFSDGWSVKALWTGSGAKITVLYPNNSQTVSPAETRHAEWGDTLITTGSGGENEFTPWLEVSFFTESGNLHRWMNVTAETDIIYPDAQGNGFTNKNEHVIRNFAFFVVSPEEFEMLSAHNNWTHQMAEREDMTVFISNTLAMAILPLILLFFGLVLLIAVYHDRRKY